jgi:hypothetical protein
LKIVKRQYIILDEAFKYRLGALTDDCGRCKFERMCLGKYYIETKVNFTATANNKKQTGSTDYYNGFGSYLYSSSIYETFFYNYDAMNRENKFVEVKKDGQVLEIKLY